MDGKDLNDLRELVEFLKASEIAEFDVEKGDLKLRLKFAGVPAALPTGGLQPNLDTAQIAQIMAATKAASPVQTATLASASASGESKALAMEDKNHIVKSPIVGTFYESPSPGAAAFVKIGDTVEVGQILCIVEAMKLMNEIESDASGEIVERIAITGQPVEYGQPLFSIKPR